MDLILDEPNDGENNPIPQRAPYGKAAQEVESPSPDNGSDLLLGC